MRIVLDNTGIIYLLKTLKLLKQFYDQENHVIVNVDNNAELVA